MTTTLVPPQPTTAPPPTPAPPTRLSLIVLATVVLVGYLALFASGTDLHYDARLGEVRDAYDVSEGVSQLSAYLAMAFVALLLFFGSALRHALRVRRGTWLADVPFLGFAALAATIASWAILDLATWKAVELGDESAIRTLVTLNDAGFLPLMAAMVAIYLGSGLVGLSTGALPRWLAITSVVVGLLAPMGPLGFVGALLLPLWALAVAICVRLDVAQ